MSSTGMPSVIATIRRTPASAASMIASAANGGGTKIRLQSAPGLPDGVGHRVEDRDAVHVLPRLARGDPGDHLGAVGDAGPGVKLALLAGDPLHHYPRVLVDEDAHVILSSEGSARCPESGARGQRAIAATFCAASLRSAAVIRLRPDSARMRRPSSTLVPSIRTTTGTLIPVLRGGLDHPRGQDVAAQDAAEDVDQDSLDVLVAQDDAEPVFDHLGAGAAAHVEKVRRLRPRPA